MKNSIYICKFKIETVKCNTDGCTWSWMRVGFDLLGRHVKRKVRAFRWRRYKRYRAVVFNQWFRVVLHADKWCRVSNQIIFNSWECKMKPFYTIKSCTIVKHLLHLLNLQEVYTIRECKKNVALTNACCYLSYGTSIQHGNMDKI